MAHMKEPLDPAMENALRQALRQVDPPPGFADRVVERASKGAVRRGIGAGAWLRWATAAVLVVGASGGWWYRAEEHRREGEEARRQVLLSLEITRNKLHAVQMKINRERETQQ